MSEDKKKQYFYMTIGYSGLLLIAIAGLRYFMVFHDSIGQALTFFGYICLVSYFRYVDNKWFATLKEKLIFRGAFIVALIFIALFLYLF
jgi:hypothetical protein